MFKKNKVFLILLILTIIKHPIPEQLKQSTIQYYFQIKTQEPLSKNIYHSPA